MYNISFISSFFFKVHPDYSVRRELALLEVYCLNRRNGCSAKMQWKFLKVGLLFSLNAMEVFKGGTTISLLFAIKNKLEYSPILTKSMDLSPTQCHRFLGTKMIIFLRKLARRHMTGRHQRTVTASIRERPCTTFLHIKHCIYTLIWHRCKESHANMMCCLLCHSRAALLLKPMSFSTTY